MVALLKPVMHTANSDGLGKPGKMPGSESVDEGGTMGRSSGSRMYPVDHRAMRVVGIALVIVAATFVMGTNPAGAVSSKSATVLFVHGFSLSYPPSYDCGGDFDAMISQMRGEGF